jgi:tetratricopeptide (TPR) repeat protein
MKSMSRYTPVILVLAFGMVLTIGDRALALSPSEVGKIAKQVTVAIKSTESEYGSGIIIQHRGNIYTVLTAAHVVKNSNAYSLTTPDGAIHQLQPSTVKKFPRQVDLAVAQFTSDRAYPIAKIGDSNLVTEGNPAFVSGFPAPTAAINIPVYLFRKGDVVANSSRPLQGGYAIIYSANTLPGMSGGGVFNDRGELIATHGRGDVAESYRPDTENPLVRFKTGNDLGIPVNTLRQFATQLAIDLGNSAPAVVVQNPAIKADDFILAAEGKSLQSDYRGALTDLNRAIAINSRSAEAYVSRSQVHFTLGNARSAQDDANRALQLKPNAAKAYSVRAQAKIGLSDLSGAKRDADRAIKLSPDLSSAYGIRGMARILSGEYQQQTIADFDRAIVLDPNSIDAYLLRSELLRYLGDFSGALADVDLVIRRKSKLTEAYGVRSLIKLAKNDLDGARADAEQSIKLNPNVATEAYSVLGKIALDRGNYRQAIDYANKAIKNGSYTVSAYEIRGAAYFKLGDGQQAVNNADRALKFNPQDYSAYIVRASGYALLKNKSAALSDLRMAAKIMRALNLNTNDYRTIQQAIKLLEAN